MIFGGYRIAFKEGQQPTWLTVAWLTGSPSNAIAFKRAVARQDAHLMNGFDWLGSERFEIGNITHEIELFARPGTYLIEPLNRTDGLSGRGLLREQSLVLNEAS